MVSFPAGALVKAPGTTPEQPRSWGRKGSLIMRVRLLCVVAGLASLGGWGMACTDDLNFGGLCEVTADCYQLDSYAFGSVCSTNGFCTCPNEDELICCSDGTPWCHPYDRGCRPRSLCEAPPVIVLAAPGAPCGEADDCRGPIDPRCGAVLCEEGKCRFETQAGEKIKNQYPGDCQVNFCNYDGDVEMQNDASDLPLSGNPCSWDVCVDGEIVHKPLDGVPCPGKDLGFCIQGSCYDCSEVLGLDDCPGSLLCAWDMCVPASCKDGIVSGMETAKDCGGTTFPSCRPCDLGDACVEHSDCFSSSCAEGMCQEATHADGRQNADETGVDCGYPGGPLRMCKDGEGCLVREDCMSDVCYLGKCVPPTCTDNRLNGTEIEPDCGGDVCQPCPPKSE